MPVHSIQAQVAFFARVAVHGEERRRPREAHASASLVSRPRSQVDLLPCSVSFYLRTRLPTRPDHPSHLRNAIGGQGRH